MNPHRMNAFINVNGIPYLLGDYIDRARFQMVDRGLIQDGIYIDTTEPMRAVVDIRIDDIGKKNSDGDPNSQTNAQKVSELLEAIRQYALRGNAELPMLYNSIVARINYQLENNRTGQIIRSMVEDIRIPIRNNYIDISSVNPDSQAILSNFCNTSVSAINRFTVAQDVMQLRITSVKFYYEKLQPGELVPPVRQMEPRTFNDAYCGPFDNYLDYHEAAQSQHYLGTDGAMSNCVVPPDWCFFNYFYHFENNGRNIALHKQQIMDPRVKKILVPCANVTVNRCFLINPGHRIIFKFSIWKNDMCIMGDTTPIAKMLRAPVFNPPHCDCDDHCHHDYDCYPPHHNHDAGMRMDFKQNAVINQLNDAITSLTYRVDELQNKIDPPTEENPDTGVGDVVIPELPEKPIDVHDPIKALYEIVKDLSDKVDALIEDKTPDDTIDSDTDIAVDSSDNTAGSNT